LSSSEPVLSVSWSSLETGEGLVGIVAEGIARLALAHVAVTPPVEGRLGDREDRRSDAPVVGMGTSRRPRIAGEFCVPALLKLSAHRSSGFFTDVTDIPVILTCVSTLQESFPPTNPGAAYPSPSAFPVSHTLLGTGPVRSVTRPLVSI
jgi:hypothetical protein